MVLSQISDTDYAYFQHAKDLRYSSDPGEHDGAVFERILLPIVDTLIPDDNNEAKASQVPFRPPEADSGFGIENERKDCSVMFLPCNRLFKEN